MARDFDGVDDIIAGTITAMADGDWTAGAWINADTAGEGNLGRIIQVDDGAGAHFVAFSLGAGPVARCAFAYTTTNALALSSTAVTAAVWTLNIATHRASDNTVRLYIGTIATAMAEAAYTTQTAGVGTFDAVSTKAEIGNITDTSRTFDGRIHVPFLVPRELSVDQMEQFRLGDWSVLWNGTVIPRFFLPLDSPTAAQCEDLSGNGVAFTLTGAVIAEGPPVPGCFMPDATRVTGVVVEPLTVGGAITPTGSLVRVTNKPIAGSLTPAGSLVRQTNKALAGGVTPAGSLSRVTAKPLAGSVTPAGAMAKVANKVPSGAMTPSGELDFSGVVALAGQITPIGTLVKLVNKLLAGGLTPSGALTKVANVSYVGGVTPSGDPDLAVAKALGGTITPSGALTKAPAKAFAGALAPSGTIAWQVNKALGGSLTPSGALAKAVSKTFSGAIVPSGGLSKVVAKTFSGVLGLSGSLVNVFIAGVLALPGKVVAWIDHAKTFLGISKTHSTTSLETGSSTASSESGRTIAWIDKPSTQTDS